MSTKFIYGLVIFSSAFLLFQVQPILGKTILPWLGGAAGVWIVCLLFFQVVLLLGYLHAHGMTRIFRPRAQARVHALLLLVSILVLPIIPKHPPTPSAATDPAFRILWLLGVTVGLPYFLLSSTSPLLQAWYARKDADAAPYRFYAVSNAGSMLALVSYPILVEPWIGTSHQALGWSWAYAAVALLCAVGALAFARQAPIARRLEGAPPPPWTVQVLWISLAACGSALLLAITHHITQNIASVPLLWVIPLALYLLTFILCFEGRAWYRRDFFLRLLGVALGSMAYAVAPSFAGLPVLVSIPLFCCCLFVCCMFCHGELARLKPDPTHLTSFYLMCSLGGAIGALFVAGVAPRLFSGDYELRIAIGYCALLVLVVHHRDPESRFYRARWQSAWLLIVALALAIIVSLAVTAREEAKGARVMVRNFYGVLRVVEQVAPNVVLVKGEASPAPEGDFRCEKLMNGTIDHGLEFLAPARRHWPTTYYGPDSGIGITLEAAGLTPSLNVGVIGLGVGTLAAYGRPGDRYRFYEINPLVVQIANREFSFLRDSAAKVDIVLGDGRLSLEQEQPQGFDVLVVDAFSGDSIPVHLLTQEAFALYFRHLQPEGVLAVHISNQYLNLAPVVAGSAIRLSKEAVLIENGADSPRGIYRARWVLVGNPQGFLGKPEIEKAGIRFAATSPQLPWTDDYSSLFKILM
jgi:hypothetical protein